MILTYLSQLKNTANETGWELRDACIDAGLSDTTYYRWNKGTTTPREQEAKKVSSHMLQFRR